VSKDPALAIAPVVRPTPPSAPHRDLQRAEELPGAARGDTWARRLLGPFHVTGVFWLKALMWVSRGSEVRAVSMVWLWSAVFFFLLRRPRRIVTQHLEVVLGPCGWLGRQLRIFRAFKDHAWCLVERFEQFCPGFAPRLDVVGDWAGGGGFIVCTAHVGLWEMGQLMPVVTGERQVHVVREREEHAETHRIVADLLARHPNPHLVTHWLDDDPQLGAKLLAALRRGDAVMLAGDRAKEGMPALPATMFGRPVLLPAGPLALARAAEVDIVPTFVYRVGRRHYRVVTRPMLRVGRTPDRTADLRAAAERLAAEFEWAVREDPFQWKRWEPLWPNGVGIAAGAATKALVAGRR
jgi:predicted LPLAT superfamily acyltransferase